MSDLDLLYAFGERIDEAVVNRGFDEGATRGGAPLAVEAVDHEQRRIECALEIRVGEDDHRIFAAELEMHALQGRRPLRHDVTAGRGVPDETHRLDERVLGQGLAGLLAEPMHAIHHARRQARLGDGLVHDLGESTSR